MAFHSAAGRKWKTPLEPLQWKHRSVGFPSLRMPWVVHRFGLPLHAMHTQSDIWNGTPAMLSTMRRGETQCSYTAARLLNTNSNTPSGETNPSGQYASIPPTALIPRGTDDGRPSEPGWRTVVAKPSNAPPLKACPPLRTKSTNCKRLASTRPIPDGIDRADADAYVSLIQDGCGLEPTWLRTCIIHMYHTYVVVFNQCNKYMESM